MVDGMAMNVDVRRLEQIADALPGGLEDFLDAVGTEMVGDVQMGMQGSPADGITYTRGGVTHTASSAGNPPRPDSGELLASITFTPTGTLERTIHDGVEYGVYQELGTEFIEARPFMVPVFEEWRARKFAEFVRRFPLVT